MARQERFAMLVADAVEAGGQWRSGLEPRFIGRTILGAVSALVTARIEAGDVAALTGLRPSISEFMRALLEP
jgi:hypothetical protein